MNSVNTFPSIGGRRLPIALLLAFVLSVQGASAQAGHEDSYPQVGKQIPDYMFSDVDYFGKRNVSISDFRGKWLLLDFWARYCVTCIAGMPQLSQLQTQMGDKMQILLVGLNFKQVWSLDQKQHPGSNGDDIVRSLYRQIRNRDSVTLPVAWDTVLFKKWMGSGVPFTVVVDPSGAVRAVTSGIYREQVEALMAGKHPPLVPYELDIEKPDISAYNYEMPFLTRGKMANGGTDTSFLFRDVLAKANPNVSAGPVMLFRAGTFTMLNKPLGVLYRIAYTGKDRWDNYDSARYGHIYDKVVYRSKDSLALRFGQQYCYSLTLYQDTSQQFKEASDQDRGNMQQMLQRDLALNFPYKAALADTMVNILELVISDSAKARELTSKGIGPRELRVFASEIDVRNTPMDEFAIRILQRTIQHHMYVVNKTGIAGNIDMKAKNSLTGTLKDVNEVLSRVGLRLVPAKKLMKALVITD